MIIDRSLLAAPFWFGFLWWWCCFWWFWNCIINFVFESGYELRTLEEVEEHIKEKGHLPEVPSEAEVVENGINLGEMDAKLLQKIEELTLYMIDMNKRMNQLEMENQELKAKVNKLEND